MKGRVLCMLLACVMLTSLIPSNIVGAEENMGVSTEAELALTEWFNENQYQPIFRDGIQEAFLADIDNDKVPELLISTDLYRMGFTIYKYDNGEVFEVSQRIWFSTGTGISDKYNLLMYNDGKIEIYRQADNYAVWGTYEGSHTIQALYQWGATGLVAKKYVEMLVFDNNSELTKYNNNPEASVWDNAGNVISPAAANEVYTDFCNEVATFLVWEYGNHNNYNGDLNRIWNRQQALYAHREEDASIKVTVNGKEIIFDQPPVIINDRTLVPLRAIFQEVGATVEWDGVTKTVTATKGETVVKLTIGQATIYKNGESITLDVPAQLVNDRTLVPVRAVAESLDCLVDWNGETRTVIIKEREYAVKEHAKYLCEANEKMGGEHLFASYFGVDTTLYTTLMDIMVALECQNVVLDTVSTTTAIGTNVGMAAKGDFSGVAGTVGETLRLIYENIEVADVIEATAKDAIKAKTFEKIQSSVPDMNTFVLNLGTTAYDRNEKMFQSIVQLHMKIKNGDFTYADAAAYIVALATSNLNRKTMAMAVQVLSDELPDNFLESFGKTFGTSLSSFVKTYLGNKISSRGINVGLEVFTDLTTAYAEYAGGEMDNFIALLKAMDHPAFTEWAKAIEEYEESLNKQLFLQK